MKNMHNKQIAVQQQQAVCKKINRVNLIFLNKLRSPMRNNLNVFDLTHYQYNFHLNYFISKPMNTN